LWNSKPWVEKARRSAAALTKLQPNWDDQGSPAPKRIVLDVLDRLIGHIECYDLTTAHIGPVSGGGVGIEWRYGMRDLNIEILADGSLEYLKAEKSLTGFDSMEMVDGRIASDRLNDVRPLVRWLLGS